MLSVKDRLKPGGVVALKSSPDQLGRIVRVCPGGRSVRVQFEGRSSITTHSLKGLIVLSHSAQLQLFHEPAPAVRKKRPKGAVRRAPQALLPELIGDG